MKLGAHWNGKGTNFTLYSEQAEQIDLCLFQSDEKEPGRVMPLSKVGEHLWNTFVPGVAPGTQYGYRVSGSYEPQNGVRCNPAKVLLDPYARGVLLPGSWHDSLYDYQRPLPDEASVASLQADPSSNAAYAPRGVVLDEHFDWRGATHPNVSWSKTVLYEAHVKGLTWTHPQVSPELRGTYLGLCAEPLLRHYHSLGVTAIELLPVHASMTEPCVEKRGLSNYWGYNTVSFFALDPRYGTAAAKADPQQLLREFKEMVATFHRVGIEVILDVVYNHSAEGNQFGPTFSFRGLDERVYYRFQKGEGVYEDFTGCGNTLNSAHPAVLRLILDSLRYFAADCGIDGFRLDLASAISRDAAGNFLPESPLCTAMLQDPILQQRKIISESWDATPEGYQVGNFPQGVSEWNGKYRDTVRRFWRGDERMVPQLASALSGSSEIFGRPGRTVRSSINFVTAHDGFTLFDLVSYERRHNDDNGESGRDGSPENFSANNGAEGMTDDEAILSLRQRQSKNFLATLFFSLGVPMMLAGDEGGRTQHGNNNAYCQDNQTSWVDWERAKEFAELKELIGYLAMLREHHPALLRQQYFTGRLDPETGRRDVVWMLDSGDEIRQADWDSSATTCLQAAISGEKGAEDDSSLLLLFNPTTESKTFCIGRDLVEKSWRLLLRTDEPVPFRSALNCRSGELLFVPAKTLMVFHAGVKV